MKKKEFERAMICQEVILSETQAESKDPNEIFTPFRMSKYGSILNLLTRTDMTMQEDETVGLYCFSTV